MGVGGSVEAPRDPFRLLGQTDIGATGCHTYIYIYLKHTGGCSLHDAQENNILVHKTLFVITHRGTIYSSISGPCLLFTAEAIGYCCRC